MGTNQIGWTVILLMCVFLIAGCGRSASPPKAVAPMSPAIYKISADVKKKVPQDWEDLENYASSLQGPARQDALDAIRKIKDLNYKVTWGIDSMVLKEKNASAKEYVLFESPDGHLKSTYGGTILKEDPEDDKEIKLEKVESDEKKTETATVQ